ncbi:hypothetical protein GGD70_000764 [Paraburkholderia fungorum]|nr:hypothetical protein [Paraburkholderia fungorum]
MVDVLSGVDRAREPVRFIAMTIPSITEGVAIHHRADCRFVGLNRFGKRFHCYAVFVHAAADPHDQALTRIPVEVEQPLFFSLFHNVPVSRLIVRAFEKQKTSLNNAKPVRKSDGLGAKRTHDASPDA